MNLSKSLIAGILISQPTFLHAQAIDIQINFFDVDNVTAGIQSGFTPAQETLLLNTANTWESYVTGYSIPGLPAGLLDGIIEINAGAPAIDGPGMTLGSAAPTGLTYLSGGGVDIVLTDSGVMQFDSADVAGLDAAGTLDEVFLHEMGHVLGIGTLWEARDRFTREDFFGAGDPNASDPVGQDFVNVAGEYIGPNALAQYQVEFDPGAAFVPVELDGGAGTANGHWNEAASFGPEEDGIVDVPNLTVIDPTNPNFGMSLQDALMSGRLSAPTEITNTTLGSLVDLGYSVNFLTPVPEPTTGLLAMVAFAGSFVRRRRS